MLRRGVIGSIGALAVVMMTSGEARADWDLQLAADMRGGWLRETPDLDVDKLSLGARDVRKGTIRNAGGVGLLGIGVDSQATIDDHWIVPLFGGNLMWAIGSYDPVRTSDDGSIARLHPWSTFRGDFLLPGIGHRWKHRRTMIAFDVRTGVSWLGEYGSVASGRDSAGVHGTTSTFLVQAEIEACRRLDPMTRVCLQVSPRIYEYSWLNGGTVGLRVEWGR